MQIAKQENVLKKNIVHQNLTYSKLGFILLQKELLRTGVPPCSPAKLHDHWVGEEGRGKDGGDRAVQSSPRGDRETEWHSSPHSVQTPFLLWKSRENMSYSCFLL